MIKKIILVILALATICFIGDTNLIGNSVYYAKHSSSSNVRDLELMMFTENLDILDKKDGFKYKHKIQEEKSVQNVKKNVYFGCSMHDDGKEYVYISNERQNYYFNDLFMLDDIIDFGNGMKHIDKSTVDENKIKEEIYENFKPILKELEEEYEKGTFALSVIYGRRRVGKTYLIKEFLKRKMLMLGLSEAISETRKFFATIE